MRPVRVSLGGQRMMGVCDAPHQITAVHKWNSLPCSSSWSRRTASWGRRPGCCWRRPDTGVRTQNALGRLTEGGRPSGRDSPPLGGGTLSRLVAAAVVSIFCRREEKKSPISLGARGLKGWLVKAAGKGPTLDQGVWTSVEQPRATNDEKMFQTFKETEQRFSPLFAASS